MSQAFLLSLLVSSSLAFTYRTTTCCPDALPQRSSSGGTSRIQRVGEPILLFATAARGGRLQYHNGDDEDSRLIQQQTVSVQQQTKGGDADASEERIVEWWNYLIPSLGEAAPMTEEEKSSQMVEEYFKFLDKRYQLIHDNKQQAPIERPMLKPKQQQTSQVMKWLYKDGFQYNPKDAYFAFSQAAQAGKSLLERKPMEESASSLVIPSSTANSLPAGLSFVSPTSSTLYARLARVRNLLLRYQSLKVRHLIPAFVVVVKRIPKVSALLFKVGGGQRPTSVALSIMTVVLFRVLFPAVTAFVEEFVSYRA